MLDWTPVVTTGVGALAGLAGVFAGSIGSRRAAHRQWIHEVRLSSSVDVLDRLAAVVRVLAEFELTYGRHRDVHGDFDALAARGSEALAAGDPDADAPSDLKADLERVKGKMDAAHDAIAALIDRLDQALDAWERATEHCLLVIHPAAVAAMEAASTRVRALMAATTAQDLREAVDERTVSEVRRARHEVESAKNEMVLLLRQDLLKH